MVRLRVDVHTLTARGGSSLLWGCVSGVTRSWRAMWEGFRCAQSIHKMRLSQLFTCPSCHATM